jgi:hypothetical protein
VNLEASAVEDGREKRLLPRDGRRARQGPCPVAPV